MQSLKNKKHLIKYEQNKPKQMLTQFFPFSTSVWFSQSATHMWKCTAKQAQSNVSHEILM